MSVTVTVNTNILATNRLQMGSQLTQDDWKPWVNYGSARQPFLDMRGKLMRNETSLNRDYDGTNNDGYPAVGGGPCRSWNSSTRTGTWDWINQDRIVDAIINAGAIPVLVIIHPGDTMTRLPPGMYKDPATYLPAYEDIKAYAKQFAIHYRSRSQALRAAGKYLVYNTWNEGYQYWDWTPNTTKLNNGLQQHKAIYEGLKEGDPDCLVGQDAFAIKSVWAQVIAQNMPVDYIDYHDYGADVLTTSTRTILDTESRWVYFGSTSNPGIAGLRANFIAYKGYEAPLLVAGESNFNSAWQPNSDPRNYKLEGGVYAAMVRIWGMYQGITHLNHFQYGGEQTGGFPLTMASTYKPRYPWFPMKWIGQNLEVGDPLYEVTPNWNTTGHIIPAAFTADTLGYHSDGWQWWIALLIGWRWISWGNTLHLKYKEAYPDD